MQHQVNQLVCRSGDKVILDSISFPIKKERTLVILGPGGSGKSTLLNYLNKSLPEPLEATNNMNFFDGKSIGYLTQNKMYLQNTFDEVFKSEDLNVKNEIEDRWEDKEIVSQLLQHVGTVKTEIPKSIFKLFELTLFMALSSNDDVLLLDEPDINLNENLNSLIRKINKIKKNKTLVIVTHNMILAEEVADDLMYLRYGKIVEHGNSKDFFSSTNSQVKYLIKYGC